MTLEELLSPVTKSYWESHQFENYLHEEGEYVKLEDACEAIKSFMLYFTKYIEDKNYIVEYVIDFYPVILEQFLEQYKPQS